MPTGGPGMSAMAGGGSGGGTNLRGVDRAKERKDAKDAAAKKKAAPKKAVDQYYNVVQVTVYGQARFYNSPAPIPPVEGSASTAVTPESTPTGTPAAAAAPVAPPSPPKAEAPDRGR